jgi:Domain of unknown function (DUF1330)
MRKAVRLESFAAARRNERHTTAYLPDRPHYSTLSAVSPKEKTRENMPAYVIVNVNAQDPEQYERYKQLAQETVAQFGGRYLVRGGRMQVLE